MLQVIGILMILAFIGGLSWFVARYYGWGVILLSFICILIAAYTAVALRFMRA